MFIVVYLCFIPHPVVFVTHLWIFAHVGHDKINLLMYLVLYVQIYFVIILVIYQWLMMNQNCNWHNHLTVETE
jgi:hypothetical protein